MAYEKRRLRVGFGITNPTFYFEADEEVWAEVLKILCMGDKVPDPDKSGRTRYASPKWPSHFVTASDVNYLFKFDGCRNKLDEMANFWKGYSFPRHLEPEEILRAMTELLASAKHEVMAQLVTQEKS